MQPIENLKDTLITQFAATYQEFRGEHVYTLPADQILACAQALQAEFNVDRIIDITAVDYWPKDEPRMHVVYHLDHMATETILCLRVPLAGNDLNVDSVSSVYPGATWYEREVWDLFGIKFIGNPDLRRIMLPADWHGHPLRKDYPLGYEEVEFSFNIDEIEAKKPKGQEILDSAEEA